MLVKLGNPARKNRAENIRIDHYDTWNVDVTLAHIIVPLLEQLKERKQGAPFVDSEDVPKFLQMTDEQLKTYEEEHETDDNFFKRWDYVMDQMIFAFSSKLNDWEDDFASGENDVDFAEIPDRLDENGDPLYTMVYGENHTRKYDVEGRQKYQERITNGFRLFGKYYEGLWD
tara:strand:- start:29 stop:544 length:516 start_codon:yes stop_codon:yes gene_type:complete